MFYKVQSDNIACFINNKHNDDVKHGLCEKYRNVILSFLTDRSRQTVQTQIRLLLEEQSDQFLHFLLFHLHLSDKIPYGLAFLFEF